MELANDFRIARSGPDQAAGATQVSAVLRDWAGLYARLSAAHALRRELARDGSASTPFRGSFADWPVPGCGGLPRKRAVNLKNSTDRKGPAGMEFGIAGPVHAGDREL